MALAQVAAAPTAAEAEAAFRQARDRYVSMAPGEPQSLPRDVHQSISPTEGLIAGGTPENVALDDVRLVLDVNDAKLKDVVTDVVRQAAQFTGPWQVKWRLSPDNTDLMDERVNLTAEAPFGEFFAMLAERVKNMTGIQLHFTVFSSARVILVSDTYY